MLRMAGAHTVSFGVQLKSKRCFFSGGGNREKYLPLVQMRQIIMVILTQSQITNNIGEVFNHGGLIHTTYKGKDDIIVFGSLLRFEINSAIRYLIESSNLKLIVTVEYLREKL